jgi:putative endonuclease
MRHIGQYGETLAENYLKNHQYSILTKNFYTRFGELDIIATKNKHCHIVEVKFLSKQYIHSGYKINRTKKRRMVQCTQILIDQFKLRHYYIQFDLISIVKLLKNTPNDISLSKKNPPLQSVNSGIFSPQAFPDSFSNSPIVSKKNGHCNNSGHSIHHIKNIFTLTDF